MSYGNRVIDVITYNGESELFDLRYNILKDVVDEFIVCESPTTFSGKPKPLTFNQLYERVTYKINPEQYTEDEKRLAEESPNTIGAAHWKQEFLQKERIKQAISHLDDNDLVFIGDCDEIWNPYLAQLKPTEPMKLGLKVYTYYLDNESSEEFWGTLMARYKDIKNECLNHLRTNARRGQVWGWHFTSLKDNLKQKLLDSYTEETYANKWVVDNLEKNISESKDFLGRAFKYSVYEENWPNYLKKNREKYLHLLKNKV